MKSADWFLPYTDEQTVNMIVAQIRNCGNVANIFLLARDTTLPQVEGCSILFTDNLDSSATYLQMATAAQSSYVFVYTKDLPITLGYHMTQRMLSVAVETGASIVYSNRYQMKNGEMIKAPVIPYQEGSVRNDFDFGSIELYKTNYLKQFACECRDSNYITAGKYELTLFCQRTAPIFFLDEYLYTEEEKDLRKSGEKQFDYVDPRNQHSQLEMEQVCTNHLKKIGAYISPNIISNVPVSSGTFQVEASVIIPVRNRKRTIDDAIMSALSQRTKFKYNVFVIDNHSTDGTTETIKNIADKDPRVIHIIPERKDLGIGGCWDVAVNDERCGRFAIQLDSDDLYTRENTLQMIVDLFYKEQCAMVIGSYRMCNISLRTLPPGKIDHKEWTDENGRNNALRINGLGAPRAFYTPLLRCIGVPNTCYGEDYALGLAFSRKFKIGRIYDELYLCRRWEGNSDAALSVDKINANNYYKDELRTIEIRARQALNRHWNSKSSQKDANNLIKRQLCQWKTVRERYKQLEKVEVRDYEMDGKSLRIQFNPARFISTGAKIDNKTIASRPCFLCENNLPEEQEDIVLNNKFHLLVNPFPILPKHFTIPLRQHSPQLILEHFIDMVNITDQLCDMVVFYNGSLCGASAPDHMHFQAGCRGILPIEKQITPVLDNNWEGVYELDWFSRAIVISTNSVQKSNELFMEVYNSLPIKKGQSEPMMNILSWKDKGRFVTIVIPRKKHRPDCYKTEEKGKQLLVSPGALDMAGLMIVPRKEDFDKISKEQAVNIIKECGA